MWKYWNEEHEPYEIDAPSPDDQYWNKGNVNEINLDVFP